ncbi:hypothetical protein [Urinicoccus massiliensis]|uniref:hypothetical protein n=1 Tax=Urinicoccus massiliensis TaxID=1723382 RepID=UPI00093036ED|nr:hypothetical protein [Urinicoccus massiliensis]
MKKTMKRKLGTILLVGCLALGAAACDKASAAGYSNSLVSHEEIQDEFVKTCKSLNWPEGYEVPKEIDYKKDGSSYEKGFGTTRASLYWEAAWEREWLNSYKTDPERAEKALAELEKATKMTYMSPAKCDDATREAFAKYLDQARHGDPSGFEENIKLNAPE